MKNILLILVMLVATTTAYTQTSRRTANVNSKNPRSRTANNTTYASNKVVNRNATRVNTHSNSNTRHRNTQNSTTYANSRESSKHRSNSYHHNNHTTKVYRTVNHVYHRPVKVDVVWTRDLHRHYVKMYPSNRHWNYSYGHRISSAPAHNADFYIGNVKKVYGRISDVYYARNTDEYFLYIGPYFPHQHFTIIIPGQLARNYSNRPERYFMNQNIHVTGLITSYEGNPEIVVRRNFQLSLY